MSYQGRVFTGQKTKPTMSKHGKKILSFWLQPICMSTPPCYNNATLCSMKENTKIQTHKYTNTNESAYNEMGPVWQNPPSPNSVNLPFLTCNVFTADTLCHAVTMTSDALTLNVYDTSGVTSKSIPNLSEIERFVAELLMIYQFCSRDFSSVFAVSQPILTQKG